MRFHPILLMTLPPGDADDTRSEIDYTRPAPPAIPDTNSVTGPMPSPYAGTTSAPPPPPPTGSAPIWRPAGMSAGQRAVAPSRPIGLLVVAGVLVAVALIAFGGIALVLAQHAGGNASINTSAAKIGATNTPKATATTSPTATPTTAPTETPSEGDNQIPPPPPGFQQYTEESGGIWGLDIPDGMNPMSQNGSDGAVFQQQTTFPVSPVVRFDIFDLSQPVGKGDFSAFWRQIKQAVGVPANIPVYAAGNETYSLNWQVWQTQSSFGQLQQVKLLYHKNGDQATAIAIVGMGSTAIDNPTAQVITDMLNSFTYLSS